MSRPDIRSPSSVSTSAVSNSGAITVNLPSGWQQGDLLILMASSANEAFPTSPPTGWNNVPNAPVGFGTAGAAGGLKLFVWWKIAGASESAVNIGDSGSYNIGNMIAIYNHESDTDPFALSYTGNVTTASTTLGYQTGLLDTYSDRGGMVLYIGAGDRDSSATPTFTFSQTGMGIGNSLSSNVLFAAATNAGAGGCLFARYNIRAVESSGSTLPSYTAAPTIDTSQVSSYWIGVIRGKSMVAQENWRFRNDNGTESSATWMAAAGADATLTVSEDTIKRIRFSLSSRGGRAAVKPVLQFSNSAIQANNRYDLTKYTWSDLLAVSAGASYQDSNIYVSSNGQYMYLMKQPAGAPSVMYMHRWTMSTAYLPSSASDDGTTKRLDVSTVTGSTIDNFFYFKSDGSKLFLLRDKVYQATLSTAWDVSTAGTFTSFTIATSTGNWGLSFNDDGTRMFYRNGNYIRQYTLSTAWDVTTGTEVTLVTTVFGANGDEVCDFNSAGTKVIVGSKQYNLSTAWDLSTATLATEIALIDSLQNDVLPRRTGFDYINNHGFAYVHTSTASYIYYINTDILTGGANAQGVVRLDCDLFNDWTNVTTTSSPVQAVDSANLTNADNTTQQISSGTYISSNSGVSETGTAGTSDNIDFVTGAITKVEVEYAFKLIHSALASGTSDIRFRLAKPATYDYRIPR